MTAGMAANSPSAVANSASAIPGATTARLVLLAPAMSLKLRMIPQTVPNRPRSEEHTSELQSLMRIWYAVFCMKKQNKRHRPQYSLAYFTLPVLQYLPKYIQN